MLQPAKPLLLSLHVATFSHFCGSAHASPTENAFLLGSTSLLRPYLKDSAMESFPLLPRVNRVFLGAPTIRLFSPLCSH